MACVKKFVQLKNGGYINENSFENPDVYAAYYKDKEILVNSTSGGAFTAVVQMFCDKKITSFLVQHLMKILWSNINSQQIK